MKDNFRYIIIIIIGSLSIVFLIQLLWLKGLYNSIEAETEKSVLECLIIANTSELEYRIDSIKNSSKGDRSKREISITQSIGSIKDEKEDEDKKLVKKKRVVQEGDTIRNLQEMDDDGFGLVQFEKMGTIIREVIHQTIDSIAPIRLDTLQSALSSALNTKAIKADIYKIEIVDLVKDSVMQNLDVAEVGDSPFILNYTYDSDNQYGYRIYMESLTKMILFQMLGILITTVLIIFILAFAFWYLIRIIFQQKTLEDMKDDFTNNMTHELKTPIAVAYAATDALLNFGQGDNKERREKYLAINKEQLENLSSLVEQILSMSMERRLKLILKKEDIHMRNLFEALTEQYLMKYKREITFNIDVQPDDLTIYADKTHLNNVISNLIDNSIKYTKGKVVIDIFACKDGQYNIIKVKDNGIGIAQDKHKYLFEKFYRVPQGNKHNAKGYGIGLFYVKTIVEKHAGEVSLVSAIGKGSEFTIKIPVE